MNTKLLLGLLGHYAPVEVMAEIKDIEVLHQQARALKGEADCRGRRLLERAFTHKVNLDNINRTNGTATMVMADER